MRTRATVFRQDLIETYMDRHYSGTAAAVFLDPQFGGPERTDRLYQLLGLKLSDVGSLLSSEVIVYTVSPDGLTKFVNELTQSEWGYVLAWDGKKFVSHN
jgi:hypothetical protein